MLLNGIGQNTADIQYATRFYVRPVNTYDARIFISGMNKHQKFAKATINDGIDGMLYELYDTQVIGKHAVGSTTRHAKEFWITLKFGHLRFRCGPPYCKKVIWGETVFGPRI